ncbi:rNA polymerase sigma factor [Fusobacterium sp. CAG:439]|nr:rNA polymerase sigma factor [Fusobacterium sp. CAG:439]HIT91835.1 sigma-70 family RNA polymerase sigma factor [Candidatus Stercorousia faecigallinarum]
MDFKQLIRSNQNNVRSIIRLITKETNEDLEQEVYVKVLKNADKYKEQGAFKSWINTIAKNVSKDYLKSVQKRNQGYLTSDEEIINSLKDKKESPELKLISNDRQKRILDAVNSLKPKFKQTVMLCEIYGYSYEDAAYKLKCPVGTIKSRLYNAKKELAVLLKDLL